MKLSSLRGIRFDKYNNHSLSHRSKATSICLFYKYFQGNWSDVISAMILDILNISAVLEWRRGLNNLQLRWLNITRC